jgi:hypothetical protein
MMADQNEPQEKYLSDFKGSSEEQRRAKSDFISKYGYEAFEKLVLNSRKSVQR